MTPPRFFIFAVQIFAIIVIGANGSFAAGKKPITQQEAASKVKKLAEAEWENIKPKTDAWRYRISPPFPASWPALKGSHVIFYVFAAKMDLRKIMDGEHVAAPWAKIELDPGDASPPTIDIKGKKLADLGVQGIRPLSKEELAAYKEMDLAQDAILNSSGKNSAAVRKAYCVWAKTNSVISKQIETEQRNFFDWIGCGYVGKIKGL